MQQKIKNLFWHLPKSIFNNIRYGFPSKKLILIGITGTDGKTTTCTLIHQILKNAGIKAGLITTIGAKIGDEEINTGLHTTSPDSSVLQKIFAKMVKAGMTHAVCEITSHSLDQNRYYGCVFEVSGLTNISHEHLDYHQTMEKYLESKMKLFKLSKFAILNKDDESFKKISNSISIPIKTYSVDSKSDFQAKNIKITEKNLSFSVNDLSLKTDSNYHYQIYNILLSLAITKHLNINPKFVQNTIKNFPETKGRREEVLNKFGFRALIDFAHTPAALKSTLSSLRKRTKNNLIVIFGATGGRDQSKRPIMGKTVSEIANISIITADDTRDEKIENINNQIIRGIDSKKIDFIDYQSIKTSAQFKKIAQSALKKHIYLNIPNRQDAFNFAIKFAESKDIIIACGKGHETTVLHGKTEYPWSESEAFRTAFRLKK
jgi:UDP-N-acetylmuramoyl-L-alanyl-D-glutamate--2,6-diaminopimelate ligase